MVEETILNTSDDKSDREKSLSDFLKLFTNVTAIHTAILGLMSISQLLSSSIKTIEYDKGFNNHIEMFLRQYGFRDSFDTDEGLELIDEIRKLLNQLNVVIAKITIIYSFITHKLSLMETIRFFRHYGNNMNQPDKQS